MRPLIIDVT